MADHYSVRAGVVLSADTTAFVGKVADAFNAETKKDLVVTSAYRGPAKQANAMYDKMSGTEWSIYRDKHSLNEIRSAYRMGKAAKQDRATIVASMTSVIEEQVGKGKFISSHLHSTAVDFQDKLFTAEEIKALKKACKDNGATVVIAEGQPKHLHVQF